MSLTVQMKTDYSSLITKSLQSLGSSSSTDMSSLTKTMLGEGGDSTLADYAAIKNGSYGKLLKAYYAEVENADTKETDSEETDDEETDDSKSSSIDTTYNAMAEKINSLSESVATLFNQSV